jgi:hypothetical protein
MEVNSISRSEMELATFEHVIDHIRIDRERNLISSLKIVHIEAVDQGFQDGSFV